MGECDPVFELQPQKGKLQIPKELVSSALEEATYDLVGSSLVLNQI